MIKKLKLKLDCQMAQAGGVSELEGREGVAGNHREMNWLTWLSQKEVGQERQIRPGLLNTTAYEAKNV
jgi:hypothetical protein